MGAQTKGEMERFDAKSGQFAPYLSGISASGVGFSRDGHWVAYVTGHWVAYVTYPEGILWRSRMDGSDKLQLTRPPLVVYGVDWSADDKKIAFDAFDPGAGSEST